MLMISSATRNSDVEQQRAGDEQPLELAAAELVRVLAEHVAGFRLTASSDRVDPAVPLRRCSARRRTRSGSCAKTRSALKIGLYELNGSWKTPWTCAVVAP